MLFNKGYKKTDTHIYFWGSIFSNFAKSEFIYENIKFSNSEQAFMYKKAEFFGDEYHMKKILNTTNPVNAKKFGRLVTNFDADQWSNVSYDIMYEVNLQKYLQNNEAKQFLISSDNRTLVEGSPVDKIWGVGIHYTDNLILDESNWNGQNLLGKVLMKVRENL